MKTEASSRTKHYRAGVVAAVLALGGAAVAWPIWQNSRAWVETDNAYLDGPVHPIAARVLGTVQAVHVQENQQVRAGDLLVSLDPADALVKKDQAEAAVRQAEAAIGAAVANNAMAAAMVRREEVGEEKARADLERMRSLAGGPAKAMARQDLDHAQSAYDTAGAAILASTASVDLAKAEAAVADARLSASRAALREAVLQCDYTRILAPVDGWIGRREVEIGQPVIPAQPLLALVGEDHWLTANFKETQVAGMHPGMAAVVRFDAIPGKDFPARVESIAAATGSKFALLPADNASGNFTRVVQRVPVRIRLDPISDAATMRLLVPGLSAIVKVRYDAL